MVFLKHEILPCALWDGAWVYTLWSKCRIAKVARLKISNFKNAKLSETCLLPSFVTANLLRYKCGRGVTVPNWQVHNAANGRTRWELASPISVEWRSSGKITLKVLSFRLSSLFGEQVCSSEILTLGLIIKLGSLSAPYAELINVRDSVLRSLPGFWSFDFQVRQTRVTLIKVSPGLLLYCLLYCYLLECLSFMCVAMEDFHGVM